MQTAVSIIALVLSVASITWQAAAFVMSGGRARAELRVGATDQDGGLMLTAPAMEAMAPGWAQLHRAQGFVRPVVAVRVRNTGRLPVTVERWGLVARPVPSGLLEQIAANRNRRKLAGGNRLSRVGDGQIGPALPFRLEVGASETWAFDGVVVAKFAAAAAAVSRTAAEVVGYAELGNGRTVVTPEAVPASGMASSS